MKKILKVVLLVILTTSCEALILKDISNQQIEVISPVDSISTNDTKIVFSWHKVIDAENYRLKVVTPNFENATKLIIDTLVTTTSIKKSLNLGSYQWSISGENSEYQTQESINSFTIN